MNKGQIAEIVSKSALNLIPGVGGALASILGDYLSARKEARLTKFIQNYFEEMNQKQDYIVRDYIGSDDFLDVFENILTDILNTRTEMKRNMLKNLLVNSCTMQKATYDKTEEFQHLVDVLPPISLLILSVFYDLRDICMDGEKSSIEKYWTKIREITDIDDETMLLDYIGELESRCLIESFRNNTYSIDSGAPLIGDRPFITEKGELFYNYIIKQEDSCQNIVAKSGHTPKAHIRRDEFEKILDQRVGSMVDVEEALKKI